MDINTTCQIRSRDICRCLDTCSQDDDVDYFFIQTISIEPDLLDYVLILTIIIGSEGGILKHSKLERIFGAPTVEYFFIPA